MTLSHALLPSRSIMMQLLLVLAGSIAIAIAAQISIPLKPVPLTLQTLAVLMVGLTLGSRLGAAAVALYVAEGAMGLPVFANGGAGLAYMAGPTGGFLVGFIAMAYVAGLAADFGVHKALPMAGFTLLAAAVLYIPGLLWPMTVAGVFGIDAAWVGTSLASLWAGWMQPFVIGDALKAVVAAMLISGAWDAMAKRS